MLFPWGRQRDDGRNFPATLADGLMGVITRDFVDAPLDHCKAVFLILFPIPIGGLVDESAEAGLAFAQRAVGARLDCSKADQALECRRGKLILGKEVVGAAFYN